MKSNGKARNAEVLAKRFGMFASVGDMEADLANARAVLACRQQMAAANERARLRRTMEDYVADHPEDAEFFRGKRGREVCRVRATWRGREYERCGLVCDMRRTSWRSRSGLADRQRLDYTVRWNRRGREAAWASW